ncbi:MAG: LamG-like jellyroll fold domain-containing protein [Saprospiraceae bacterium]
MNIKTQIRFFFVLLSPLSLAAQVSQISIPRVEQMPDQPAPYNVRDWREVAVRYDSFVYDLGKTGQYLPLVYLHANGLNYPERPVFGLHTYVGTNSPLGNEAINVLPSLVGATLSGADKSNQYGQNWVLMSQDFFNKNNGELIYLNNRNGSSGGDWWYDLMPNIYFYQLYDLYPNIGGDAAFQFTSVADRFLGAVRGMGGNDAPWQKAYMNYRAWNFNTMQPNATSVPEPEAAGAYAWVLYNAYKTTTNPEYLQGAEWSLEFLSEWETNPSYELQLPYGIYTAARMNAELGTDYDLEKMVNWTFDRGFLRGWGAIVGTWGGFNVSGLIGEANDNGNDYAFQMNGVQQAAMLAPMVRYDKRFARAIGKWILNLANATRLFYPNYLPGSLQDASAWSNTYDPDRVIGYEALREQWQSLSPYSTGDAVQGGWAATNLALYGTSSIGYLGAILEKTNVDKILKIDLLKTDFYQEAAYPTYLMYNPFPQSRTVELAVGNAPVDVYDAISETFLLQNGTGTVNVVIPANAAILVSLTPAGGTISYDRNIMLVDGVAVDYRQSAQSFQYEPRIQALAAAQSAVEFGDSTAIYGKAFDQDSDNLTWTWSATGGTISGNGPEVQWLAGALLGEYEITLIVGDESGNRDTATLLMNAVSEINLAPQIPAIEKSAPYVAPGGQISLFSAASDPNGDPITFVWTGNGGTFSGNGNSVNWTAPGTTGIYQIQLTVTDDSGLSSQATTTILVKNFDLTPGNLIAHYPFSGNANDVSGNQLHGQTSGGALFGPDFWGQSASACLLDGVNDNVIVPVDPLLNFQDGITVSCWLKATALPDHEIFPISHGSWQNRWKISITPERRVRWTLNSLTTIGDLDSELNVTKDTIYHVAATYDGAHMALYLNGELHTYRTLTGKIRTAALPLLIGQMLPGNADFNFKGTIDEVKIFDYALPPDAVNLLYESVPTGIGEANGPSPVLQIYPNPVQETLYLQCPEGADHRAFITVYDLNGRLIFEQKAGTDTMVELNTRNWKSGIYLVMYQSDSTCITARFVKI